MTKTLDLGCGARPKNPFNADEFYGVDVRDNLEGNIKSADLIIEPIPFADEMFDFVTAFDFIEHIPRVVYVPHRRNAFIELMNEIYRVLKPGGMFLSMTPAYPHAVAFRDPTHVNIITEETFPMYFDDDKRWASIYGFKGAFGIRVHEWRGPHIFAVMQKVPVPALSHDDLLKQDGAPTEIGPVMEIKQTPIHSVHNEHLLGLMRPDYASVVEVGSSSGAMAREYRKINPQCHYVGVEIDASYAEASREHCSDVVLGNVEHLDDATFARLCQARCWVFGDALEHLYDPWKLVRRIKAESAPGVEIVACIPNAQYWGIQSCLNSGMFIYQDAGLLDRTHIRWFTRLTMVDLFQANGFQVVEMITRVGQQPNAAMAESIQQMARASGADPDQALADAIPFQYVMRAV